MKYLYWLVLIVGTTYLVGWCNWSIWTYFLTLILCNMGKPIMKVKINKN